MGLKLVLVLLALLILGGAGLAIYGSQLSPEQHRMEQVLPDDRFPN